MPRRALYGYAPDTPAEKRIEEIKVLCEHFEVILKNFTKILENEQYFFCQIGAAFLSMPWIGPPCYPPSRPARI